MLRRKMNGRKVNLQSNVLSTNTIRRTMPASLILQGGYLKLLNAMGRNDMDDYNRLYPLFIPVSSKTIGITGIWLAMGFNFVLFFIVYYLVFAIINRGLKVALGRLLALKEAKGRITELDVSVPVDARDVTFISEKMQGF